MRFAALAAEQERLDREKEAAAAGGGKAQSGASAATDERYSSDPFRVISEIEQEVAQQRVAPPAGASKYHPASSSSVSKPDAVEEDNYLAPRWSKAPAAASRTSASPNKQNTNPDLAGMVFYQLIPILNVQMLYSCTLIMYACVDNTQYTNAQVLYSYNTHTLYVQVQ